MGCRGSAGYDYPDKQKLRYTIRGSLLTPRSIRQDARRKAEERTKRRAEELVSKSGSSLEDEEYEDPVSISNSSKEDEGTKTPSQSDPVDEPEWPPFEMHRPITRSTPGRPMARPKQKATRKKPEGPSSSARKKRRD